MEYEVIEGGDLTDADLERVTGGKMLSPYFPGLQAVWMRSTLRAVDRQTVKSPGAGPVR